MNRQAGCILNNLYRAEMAEIQIFVVDLWDGLWFRRLQIGKLPISLSQPREERIQ